MDDIWIQAVLSLGVGLGLAAAAGFRVFLPLLFLGAAARVGLVPLTDGFQWLTSGFALSVLGTATILEIGAYYIPWLDHLLDVAAVPSAVLAGILATAAVTTELPPTLRWAAAIIAGGGTAGTIQTLTTITRLKSTAVTGGLGNPVLATIEWIGSAAASIIAIALPAIAIVMVVALLLLLRRIGRRALARRPSAEMRPGDQP